MQWTPISNAPEPFAPVTSYFNSAPYGSHPQIPSHTSSSSWGDASTDGEIFVSDNVDPSDLPEPRQNSASPNLVTRKRQNHRRNDTAFKSPSIFSNSYAPSESINPWLPNDDYLKPSPASPPLVSPRSGMSPDMQQYGVLNATSPNQMGFAKGLASHSGPDDINIQRKRCQGQTRQLSHSPLSRSVSLDDQPASVSPIHSDGSRSPKASNPSANVIRKKPRRKAHNAIERRYRIRLNEKIAELRDSIPSLRANPGSPSDGNPKGDLTGSVQRVNKANVLEKATEYIKNLEMCNRRLHAELNRIISLSRNHNLSIQMQSLPNTFGQMDSGYVIGQPAAQFSHNPELFAYAGRNA